MLREGAAVALTTSSSMIEAFTALNARTVALAHPYVAEVGDRLKSYVSQSGFQIVSDSGLGLQPGEEHSVEPSDVLDIARCADQSDADLLFISCTALPTYDAIAPLERELKKPVITANQVTAWAVLRAVGARGCGPNQTLIAL